MSIENDDHSVPTGVPAAAEPATQSKAVWETENSHVIDVDDVVRELREHPPRHRRDDDAIRRRESDVERDDVDYGIDHPVSSIPAKQRSRLETDPCPVCGNRLSTPLFGMPASPFQLVQCDSCGAGALHPRPQPEEIAAFYPASYYGTAGAKFVPVIERAVRWIGRHRARWLLRGLPANSRVLDVGCGRGVLLQSLAEAGCEAHGFELNRAAAAGLNGDIRLRTGIHLSAADYPADHFDLVVLWHVLEHLPQPRETLFEIRRILKPHGRLALAVPNFSSLQARLFGPAWFHLDLPRHLYHFPRNALHRLLSACGFLPELERHLSLRQNPFGWVQSALNVLFPAQRNALYGLLKSNPARGQRLSGMRNVAMTLAYWLGMPLGVALSALAAAGRSGATICLTVRAPGQGSHG